MPLCEISGLVPFSYSMAIYYLRRAACYLDGPTIFIVKGEPEIPYEVGDVDIPNEINAVVVPSTQPF